MKSSRCKLFWVKTDKVDKEDEYASKPLRCDYCCEGKEEGVMRGLYFRLRGSRRALLTKEIQFYMFQGAAKESVCLLYSLIGRGHRKKWRWGGTYKQFTHLGNRTSEWCLLSKSQCHYLWNAWHWTNHLTSSYLFSCLIGLLRTLNKIIIRKAFNQDLKQQGAAADIKISWMWIKNLDSINYG